MEIRKNARWGTPAFAILLGVLFFVASAVGGQPATGVAMFAVMAIWAGFLVIFGGRSDTVGALGGRPVDERFASFNTIATAVAGTVALLVAMAGFIWALANGHSGNEFAIVVAAGGVGYVGALLWLRWRR